MLFLQTLTTFFVFNSQPVILSCEVKNVKSRQAYLTGINSNTNEMATEFPLNNGYISIARAWKMQCKIAGKVN
jgi:hypothetical protein